MIINLFLGKIVNDYKKYSWKILKMINTFLEKSQKVELFHEFAQRYIKFLVVVKMALICFE